MNITDFRKGETVQLVVEAKDRDGSALDLTGATLTMTISDDEANPPIVEVDAAPQVVVDDVPGGIVSVTLQPSDLTALTEGTVYKYDIWVDTASGVTIHQRSGRFRLRAAVQKT